MPAPADVGTLRFPQMSRSEKSVSFVTAQAKQPTVLFFCLGDQSILLNFKSKAVISKWILLTRHSPPGSCISWYADHAHGAVRYVTLARRVAAIG
jgi:hypothetical protein